MRNNSYTVAAMSLSKDCSAHTFLKSLQRTGSSIMNFFDLRKETFLGLPSLYSEDKEEEKEHLELASVK